MEQQKSKKKWLFIWEWGGMWDGLWGEKGTKKSDLILFWLKAFLFKGGFLNSVKNGHHSHRIAKQNSEKYFLKK